MQKKKAVQEESRKIDEIRALLTKGAKINSKRFIEKLEEFGEHLKANTISVLKSNKRGQRRLRRGKQFRGYFLKKLKGDKGLALDATRRAVRISKDTLKEHQLSTEVIYLINSLKARPNNETLAQLGERVNSLFEDYERDLEDFLNIEVDIGIEEARKLQRIDHYIAFLDMLNRSRDIDEYFKAQNNKLIGNLTQLKELTEVWIKQDSILANNLIKYAEKSFDYGLSTLKSTAETQSRPLEMQYGVMQFKGINYDAGNRYGIVDSGRHIDIERLKGDLKFIKDLNCNAIRMHGYHINKLILYSKEALKAGFTVWISPRLIDGNRQQTVEFVKKVAVEAELLRQEFEKKVYFIVGNELTLDSKAVFNAPKIGDRMKEYSENSGAGHTTIINFVNTLATESRKIFRGPITYAALSTETVDWYQFDIVGVNLYKSGRNGETYETYNSKLLGYLAHRKPVAITEFGICAYRGASIEGDISGNIVKYSLGGPKLPTNDELRKLIEKNVIDENERADYLTILIGENGRANCLNKLKNENEQADYLEKLIQIYHNDGVFATFVFTFKDEQRKFSDIPTKNFDLGSYGIVKVVKNGKLVPKKAYYFVRRLYGG